MVSDGYNPVNWLNQTRRNLAIDYLNLNFVTTPKLKPLHSFFAEKVFISCVWLIPIRQCVLWIAYHIRAFSIPIFWSISLGI